MKIEIKNLTKSYGENKVFDNLNLTLTDEKPICLMAPSGKGKTTLFSILLGLLKADSGEIIGIENKTFSAVFQEDRLCEELSALMNLAIVRENADTAKLFCELEKIGLNEAEIRRPVTELSGGQRRRVSIMRSLVNKSDAVLMDEPFKGLDDETRKIVIEYIKENLNGRFFMFITHEENDAKLFDAEIIRL